MAEDKVAEPKVKLNGAEVPSKAIAGLIVDQDVNMPDMCTLQLANTSDAQYSVTCNMGDAVEVGIAQTEQDPLIIFKGEVVGIEPVYDISGETKVTIRAFNRLHRLTRGKKSATFEKKSDVDIASKIAQDNGLSPQCTSDVNIQHDHVYQHNMTDLEFLLVRASRINYEVLVDDTKLIFRKRATADDSGITMEMGKDARSAEFSLKKFSPRLSSANQVQEVNVRCWDPKKPSNPIVGVAKVGDLPKKLGDKDGGTQSQSPWAACKFYDSDIPVASKEEADAIAKAKLDEILLGYITGEALAKGHPKIKAGIVVTLKAKDSRFDGKYYLTSVSHRFSHKSGGGGGGGNDGGYNTFFKFHKNAEGGGGSSEKGQAGVGNS
jgi:phage protein D